MNEEAKDDSSVLGKAVSLAAVGGGVYGTHKGVTSNYAYNWASGKNVNGRGNFASRGVEKYNNGIRDFKEGYQAERRRQRGGDKNFVYEDVPAGQTSTRQTKEAQRVLNGTPERKLLTGAKPGTTDALLSKTKGADLDMKLLSQASGDVQEKVLNSTRKLRGSGGARSGKKISRAIADVTKKL